MLFFSLCRSYGNFFQVFVSENQPFYMEKLNEYLQTLLSSCSDELRLEPDKNPYLVAENRTTDVANSPLMGTQISTMVFPLIPADVKSALPHSSEIEFVHPHNLGNFNFNVQKSPAGFIVTIRPLLVDSGGAIRVPKPLPEVAPAYTAELGTPYIAQSEVPEPAPFVVPPPAFEAATPVSYDLESSSLNYDQTAAEPAETSSLADLIYEQKETAEEYVPSSGMPEIDVVSRSRRRGGCSSHRSRRRRRRRRRAPRSCGAP